MKLFKNYKKLYKIEVENRKKYEQRYREVKKMNEDLQVSTGFAEMNKKINELKQENYELKMIRTRIAIELEDTIGFKEQETKAKEYLKYLLRQEKKKNRDLRKQLKELKDNGK